MPEEGKYLYCITKVETPEGFAIKGIEGKDVYTVCAGDLAAVVSDSGVKEYLISRENILAHQKVIEEAFKQCVVLPVSFGTIAANTEELKEEILKPKAKEFLHALKEFEGKIELGLKAFWIDMESIFQEIVKNSPEIRRLKKSKHISYQDKIAAGELVAKHLDQKREAEKERILTPLLEIANDMKENKNLGDDMILDAAFLVRKTREREFDAAVNSIGNSYGQKIKLKYVGPLPAYNFIKLRI